MFYECFVFKKAFVNGSFSKNNFFLVRNLSFLFLWKFLKILKLYSNE
ncbi:Hypothetical protein Ccan_23110 [Capnocytophaga canimorsus Cc5]|uniref:Uncharacterized protein n=1 Tax=Capnocytophaga canimorsus (strain 5) TaxID=860228 RepID=F9YVJ2_CAPCC|nr:Hypothetical protein Ccan_23110 [Capnocytophaga canimorsus Cc5]CEN48532.1 conserved hypothetical protein [Capnocytophaga canimorsus]